VELRAFLTEVATNYDRHAPMSSPTQELLRRSPEHLSELVPPDLLIRGSGGRGVPTDTPWVGVFNPDETSSPQRGVYVVYLFESDLTGVSLSLNQGMEYLRRELGDKRARERLALDAENIRGALSPPLLQGLSATMDLGPEPGARQRAYSAANIAAVRYGISSLPQEAKLRSDLDRLLDLYESALDARSHLQQTEPGSIASPSPAKTSSSHDPLANFKPKNESEYLSQLSGKVLVKTRRHEKLVREYGEWAHANGFSPATEHPRDLILRKGSEEWLVEAKVVRRGNATEAVRGALGQLYSYRFNFYKNIKLTGMVALFSESIGNLYVDFLTQCDILPVWWDGGQWRGSDKAASVGVSSA